MKDTLIGQTVGKAKIVSILGTGGMAEVYKGYQENLDRYVAVKVMHSFLASDQDFLARFQREARAMAALNHANIVSVYDFDVVGTHTYFIVMEFVDGGTLKRRLEELANRGEKLPLAEAVRITLEIADALAYAHSRGMFHRDIKPANIMLNESGRAILTDFGIAKMMTGPSHTATGSMIGTPAYMSPEQGLGQPGDERSDLYSLGVLFFQMVAGQMPFDADTPLAVVLKHVNQPIPDPRLANPDLPHTFAEVIVRAMAKDPNERYQSATEMARDLAHAVADSDVELVGALPSDLLRDRPTPAPMRTQASNEANVDSAGATVVGGQRTRVAARGGKTEVAAPPMAGSGAGAAAATAPPKKRSPLLWIGGIFLALIITLGVAAGAFAVFGGADDTPTAVVAIGDDATATATATVTLAPGEPSPTPAQLNAATINAQLTLTAAARPTSTPIPRTATPTRAPTPTVTPNLTATLLASCVYDAELSNTYTYSNANFDTAPVGASFPLNFVLSNIGTCEIPAGTVFEYHDGESFGIDEPIALTDPLPPGDEVILTTSATMPAAAATYESTWVLVEPTSESFTILLSFSVRGYIPATLTPVRPTATPTPDATVVVTALGFNFQLTDCQYADVQDYRCTLRIDPYGGGGPPYTVFIFDSDPPARYNGNGPFFHFYQELRCRAWIHEVRLQDDFGTAPLSSNLFIDTATYGAGLFSGGNCQDP